MTLVVLIALAVLAVLAAGCSDCAGRSGRRSILKFAFCFAGMLFPPSKHPGTAIPPCRDAFPATKASWNNNFSMQGCIFRWKFIPAQTFLRLWMISSVEKHPCTDFPAIRDDFFRGKHPCADFPAIRDDFFRGKASLLGLSCD